jgi:pimeloyl-ACP methyl ester carboxylesterase
VVLADQEVLDLIAAREHMTAEEGIRVMIPYIYNPATPVERIEADLAIRLETYPSPETYVAQLQGIAQWESFSRLGRIEVPTLVMHGELDRLVPPENGRLLAEKIPGAELVMFPDASHLMFTDQPERMVSTVLRFLRSQGHAD